MQRMPYFTEDDVFEAAFAVYKGSICTDRMDEALQQPTLAKAADLLVVDSAYWDSPDGFTLIIPKPAKGRR